MKTVLPLGDAAADLATAGGKGASLARLSRAGLPVPGGFVITTDAYRAFVADFRDELRQADAGGKADLFAARDLPAGLAAEIRSAYEAMGDDVPVAVRSSATAEDLPDLSFAGQQDTYLNIRDRRCSTPSGAAGPRCGTRAPSPTATRTACRTTTSRWLSWSRRWSTPTRRASCSPRTPSPATAARP